MGESEEAFNFFFGVATLVVADENDFLARESSQAADECGVVAESAVAVDFAELRADYVDIVAELGALGMAGDLHGFPGGEVVVSLADEGGIINTKLPQFL